MIHNKERCWNIFAREVEIIIAFSAYLAELERR